MPTVSVIIATRNRRDLLAEAVRSVQDQSFPDWELIVVDDASEDDTWKYLGSLGDTRIRPTRMVKRQERCAARNAGFRKARAASVLFLDDDDLLSGNALQSHAEALQTYPEAVASIGGYAVFSSTQGHLYDVKLTPWRHARAVFREVVFGWTAIGGQALIRRHRFDAAGGWNQDLVFAEDHDLMLRLSVLGPVVLVPGVALHYREHGQTRPSDLVVRLTEIRRRALEDLDAGEQVAGRAILAVRDVAFEANTSYERGQPLDALCIYVCCGLLPGRSSRL